MQIIGGKINPVKIICSYVLTFLSQTRAHFMIGNAEQIDIKKSACHALPEL